MEEEQSHSQDFHSEEEEVDSIGIVNPAEESEEETKTEKGVCYFPRIPPYMTPLNLRKLISQRFKLGRIYL